MPIQVQRLDGARQRDTTLQSTAATDVPPVGSRHGLRLATSGRTMRGSPAVGERLGCAIEGRERDKTRLGCFWDVSREEMNVPVVRFCRWHPSTARTGSPKPSGLTRAALWLRWFHQVCRIDSDSIPRGGGEVLGISRDAAVLFTDKRRLRRCGLVTRAMAQ